MIKAGKLKPIAVVAEQRLAGYPDIRPWRRPVSKASHAALAEHVGAGGDAEPVIDTLFKAIVEASKQPALKEAFDKAACQHQGQRVAGRSQGPGLKSELDAWKKITSEVKIDLA